MLRTNGTSRSLRGDIVFAFAVALACYLAWLLRHELLLLYVSALFAVVLKPLVIFIGRVRIGRWRPFHRLGIFVLLFLVVGGITAFGFLTLPPVIRDLHSFAQEVPLRLTQLLEKFKRLPFTSHINPAELTARIEGTLTQTATYVLLSIKNWASTIFDVGMGLILTVYFTLEGDVAYRWVLSFFPSDYRERLDATLRRAEVRMGRWLLGQGTLMVLLGVASTITFVLLKVRYAYALGFLTGLLNIIPVVGAAVSIALTMLVAALDSWGRVLGVLIFYVAWANLENSFLIPRIMKSSVDLPGLAILVALVVGSSLAGVVGAMVSVPTAVLVAVLMDEYLVSKET